MSNIMSKIKKVTDFTGYGLGIVLLIYYLFMFFFPLQTNTTTFKKGDHQIIVQGMIHTAENDFYKNIVNKVKKHKNNNYEYYYELVKGENETNEGISNLTKKDTELLAKSGLTSQNHHHELYIGVNADLTREQMKEYAIDYDLYTGVETLDEILNETFGINTNDSEINEKEYSLYSQFTFRMSFRYSVRKSKQNQYLYGIKDTLTNNYINDIIIDKRNEYLVSVINNNKNAFITYGNDHLVGIEKLLIGKGYEVIERGHMSAF